MGTASDNDSMLLFERDGWDMAYAWCRCAVCGKFGIEFCARGERICEHAGTYKDNTGNDPALINAYMAARSARFEHGENG